VDGEAFPVAAEAGDGDEGKFLAALYRALKADYPKFFKMDALSKLGFLASELILRDEAPRFVPREDIAVVCFNRSASLATDVQHQAAIQREDSCYPSPSVFVYTLPNIVAGEIAIRNKLLGETSFYVCREWSAQQVFRMVSHTFCDGCTRAVLAAWVECFEGTCEAFMMLVEQQDGLSGLPFSVEQVDILYQNTKLKLWKS
jgi:3-oxoacyl-[acyl-carrier-protein] synthase-1